jgi:hypothetical protein
MIGLDSRRAASSSDISSNRWVAWSSAVSVSTSCGTETSLEPFTRVKFSSKKLKFCIFTVAYIDGEKIDANKSECDYLST